MTDEELKAIEEACEKAADVPGFIKFANGSRDTVRALLAEVRRLREKLDDCESYAPRTLGG